MKTIKEWIVSLKKKLPTYYILAKKGLQKAKHNKADSHTNDS